ncbi:Cut9-interacting protein scn1 [Cladophialophora chaetospira]|uniref:Cut9-interacting protein scn1 n=1 Tax=Cladophialophora chaetospira TaxID=386627 RepID=A0AA39CHJ9_9EURO|nr:Cut9-interacting protein scn1 [Cladophialophora chaetospira]
METGQQKSDAIWQMGIFDAHCHPTDIVASIQDIASMKARVLTVMSTRAQDQDLVQEAAKKYPLHTSNDDFTDPASRYVVPAFGWHPWFSHQMYDDLNGDIAPDQIEHYKSVLTPRPDDVAFVEALPSPRSLRQFLLETEERLQECPYALVGEVGLDRSFRLPQGPSAMTGDMKSKTGGSEEDYTPGTREGRPLSPYRVDLNHQKTILRAQFELAAKLRRPVSVHSVQAHGLVFDLMQALWKGLEKPSKAQRKKTKDAANAFAGDNQPIRNTDSNPPPFPPRICMHSYSGPPEALKQFLAPTVPADIYFSFSTAINFSNTSTAKVTNVIKAVPHDRILIESDLHCAGERMDQLLEEIVLKVCEVKGWTAEEGAKQLKENWMKFVFG